MIVTTYEQQREQIVRESRHKKRLALVLTIVACALVMTAFIVVCYFKLEWIGFSVVALLVLLGLAAKLGGQTIADANKLEKHRLKLLDENEESGGFKWK